MDVSSWEERASTICQKYRRQHDIKKANYPNEPILQSSELVEIAFLTAAQIAGISLAPESSMCIVKRLFGNIPHPTFFGLFFGTLCSKLLVDCGIYFDWAVFRWLPRSPRSQMLAPFNRINVEISCWSALFGLGLGHLSSVMGRSMERGHHQLVDRFWIFGKSYLMRIPLFLLRDAIGRCIRYIPLSCAVTGFAPVIAQNLIELGREAQQRRRFLTLAAVQRLFWTYRESWQKRPEWVEDDIAIPNDFLCPITRLLFVDPVVVNGHVFERHAVEQWIAKKCRHPILNTVCTREDVKSATEIRDLVREFAAQYALKLQFPHQLVKDK